jgi:hypothetical protein
MGAEILQKMLELYPKYDITIDIKRKKLNYSYKYFKSAHYMSSHLADKNMLDVYNSIDYVMQFLLENNFIRTNIESGNYTNKNFNIIIIIRHNGYLLLEGDWYVMYSSDGFIEKIKQLLYIETPFKKALND